MIIALVLSFFVTPLGEFSKELLNKTFAVAPTIIPAENQGKIVNYDWELKRADWSFFNFKEAKGQVVFINFWTTWHLPSRAQLDDIQKLYDKYQGDVKFYIITNQERELPEEMMARKGYTFPLTYEIIGQSSSVKILQPAGSYVIDKKGNIVVHQTAIADWDNGDIDAMFSRLISE